MIYTLPYSPDTSSRYQLRITTSLLHTAGRLLHVQRHYQFRDVAFTTLAHQLGMAYPAVLSERLLRTFIVYIHDTWSSG